MEIDSKVKILGVKMPSFLQDELRGEPMLRDCTLAAAKKKGGPVTRALLDLVPYDWLDVPLVVNTTMARFEPGWHAAPPGWGRDVHHVGRLQHIVGTVNAAMVPMEFALGKVKDALQRGDTFDSMVDKLVASRVLVQHRHVGNQLVEFNDHTWRRHAPASAQGWMWRATVTRYRDAKDGVADMPGKRANEVVKQTQVYVRG